MCRWQLPLGVIVRPMADEALGRSVPVIPLGSHGIVRCRRCRTYMNPFCQWVDGGRRFTCNVCAMMNEVPVEYFSTLDANGVRCGRGHGHTGCHWSATRVLAPWACFVLPR